MELASNLFLSLEQFTNKILKPVHMMEGWQFSLKVIL